MKVCINIKQFGVFPTDSCRSEPHCSVSACLPTCKTWSDAERICIKFYTGRFCQKFVGQCSTEDVIKISEKLVNY